MLLDVGGKGLLSFTKFLYKKDLKRVFAGEVRQGLYPFGRRNSTSIKTNDREQTGWVSRFGPSNLL